MVCENRSTETETTKIYNKDRLHQVTFFSKQEPIKVSPCSYACDFDIQYSGVMQSYSIKIRIDKTGVHY